ncbi:MAG: DUF4968 domain-containing protein, partial [candidate division KSB1 bacterium]|nr:DUF4968 domain-containing protein [candidate division KSB1 bacterium]
MTKRSAILYVFTAVTFWLPLTLKANFQFLGNVQSFHQQQNQLILNCGVPQVQITVLAPDLIRIRMTSNGHFPEDHSYAVVKTDWPATEPSVQDSPHEIVITTAELVLRINKSPCRLAFYDQAGNLINKDYPPFGMGWDGDKITCWKEMTPDEKFYGLGEKVGGINKRGHTWVMWNTDAFGYTDITDPLYQSHPFFLGLRQGRGYGIFFDNTYRSEFRLASGTDEFYSFGADGGEMNYYFFYGPGLKKILTRFTELVGRMPLPPKWALGYQQCRWSYYPESEVRRIARTFREKQIPCDVIYLDIHYMDGYRCFTWDKQRFPDPKKLLADLEAMGFKVVVIIDPGIKVDPGYWVHDQGLAGDHFCKYPDGRLYVGQVWPGNCYFPDFTRPETRFWWGSLYTQLLEQGVDGFWNDMNEPAVWGGTFPDVVQHHDFGQTVDHSKIHNVYGLEMARGTYEGNLRLRPDRRPFVLTRAGFTGVQRYAAVWTGDNTATWNHLSLCLPMCLSLGLVGVPFVGYDIGGFSGSPSPELYSRWLQLGSFTPLCRTHSALGTAAQEPWVYGDDFETINRNFIQKRYKLLPYLYDAFHEASISGL